LKYIFVKQHDITDCAAACIGGSRGVAQRVYAVLYREHRVIGFVRSWMMLFLSQRIDIPLVLGYFEHIYSLPMKFFAARRTGDIITRFSDAFTIKNIFTNIAL
jgi:ATP-binding cassette subfamily B protein